jgi:5-methylcytosine-specific restriction enzyme subunit McrC
VVVEHDSDPVPVANLLRMAFYAGDLLDELEQCEAAQGPGSHFLELVAGVLCRAGQRLRRTGLGRGYTEVTECSSRPRGRILIARSVASGSLARSCLFHASDDFTEDIPDNRVLKAAVRVIIAHRDCHAIREDVMVGLHAVLDDLRHVADCRLDERLLGLLPAGPGAHRYRTIRYIARLVAYGNQPDTQDVGDWAVRLVQDGPRMRKLFERFIYRFAGAHGPKSVSVGQRRYQWHNRQDRFAVDPRVPTLLPDVVIGLPSGSRVVECKYTPKLLQSSPHSATERFRSSHLQQLYCYLERESMRSPSPSGLLLYPRVGHSVCAEIELGSYPVTVATIDLSTAWQEVCSALGALLFVGGGVVEDGIRDAGRA